MALENIASLEAFSALATPNSFLVVHFAAKWLPQCQQVDDVMKELAGQSELKAARFCRVEAEDVADLSAKFNIAFAPTTILLAHGKVYERVEGVKVAELTKKVRSMCLQGDILSVAPVAKLNINANANAATDLNTRLKALINRAECMLFMKGSPEQPRCGFSRQITEIFNKNNVLYSTFDILTDEKVRQGLKTFSDWPTYPQVYVKGELIGGLDIIKDMDSSGELVSTLPCSKSQAEIDERLKKLTASSPIMVFMKGTPEQPRCGFSRKLIEILAPFKLDMHTFDILTDEEVRQELKRYADFPTYPQLWVNGELVGGLDIVEELRQAGDLESTLKS